MDCLAVESFSTVVSVVTVFVAVFPITVVSVVTVFVAVFPITDVSVDTVDMVPTAVVSVNTVTVFVFPTAVVSVVTVCVTVSQQETLSCGVNELLCSCELPATLMSIVLWQSVGHLFFYASECPNVWREQA